MATAVGKMSQDSQDEDLEANRRLCFRIPAQDLDVEPVGLCIFELWMFTGVALGAVWMRSFCKALMGSHVFRLCFWFKMCMLFGDGSSDERRGSEGFHVEKDATTVA